MGSNIGWIFGSVAAFSVVWGFFFFPELKVSALGSPLHPNFLRLFLPVTLC